MLLFWESKFAVLSHCQTMVRSRNASNVFKLRKYLYQIYMYLYRTWPFNMLNAWMFWYLSERENNVDENTIVRLWILFHLISSTAVSPGVDTNSAGKTHLTVVGEHYNVGDLIVRFPSWMRTKLISVASYLKFHHELFFFRKTFDVGGECPHRNNNDQHTWDRVTLKLTFIQPIKLDRTFVWQWAFLYKNPLKPPFV